MAKNPNQILWTDIGGVFVGTAYIFGDQTGDARGAGAMDVQSIRSDPTQVASGAASCVFGTQSTASGDYGTASGYYCVASGSNSTVIGSRSTASGNYSTASGSYSSASGNNSSAFGSDTNASGLSSTAIGSHASATISGSTASGYYAFAGQDATASGYRARAEAKGSGAFGYTCTASGLYSFVFGWSAIARIPNTVNICGPQIIRKDNGEDPSINFQSFCGTSVTLFTNEVDLKAAGSATITIPSDAKFFPDECGVTVTSASGVIVQPSMRFGNSGNHAALLAITAGSALSAAFARNRFQTLLTSAGQQDLVAEVTTGATATTLLGRFYFKGLLVEDE